MHLPRPLFLSALVATVASIAIARADVTLETTVLDPEVKGAAPTLQVTVIGASPGDLASYALKQGDKASSPIKAAKLVPFLEGPDAIGMVVVVLADGNWLANQGRSDIADSVQAAFVSLAAAGPKGSQVSVVTYAEAATVVKSAVPLAELASLKLTPGPTGPKAQRALAAGLKAGVAELDKLSGKRKVLVVIGDGVDGAGASAPSTAIRDIGKQLTDKKVMAAAMIYQIRAAEFGQPETPMKLDPVTKQQVPDEDAGAELDRAWRQTLKQAVEDAKFMTSDHASELTSKAGFAVAADSVAGELADRFYLQFPGYDKVAKVGLTWDGKAHPLVLRVDGNDLATIEATLEPKWSAGGGGTPVWLFIVIPVALIGVGAGVMMAMKKKPATAAASAPGAPAPGAPGAAPGAPGAAPGAPGAAPGAPGGAAPGKPMKTQFINLAGDDVFPIVGWLVFLNGPQKFKTHKLGSGVTKIGTDKASDIVIDDGYMSTNHALVLTTPDGFTLQDNTSRNGTFVNNQRVSKHELQDSDVVTFGQTQLKFKATI
jgi:hypothetical protein